MPRYMNSATEDDINIINMAMDLIHARNIATIGEGLTMEEEQKAANIYENTRSLLLRKFPWSFSVAHATVLNYASAAANHFVPYDYEYMSTLPSDCLRVLEVPSHPDLPWKRYQTNYLLCDVDTSNSTGNELWIKYIIDNTAASVYDPNFIEVLSVRLAKKLAVSISNASTKGINLHEMEEIAIAEARQMGVFEEGEFPDEEYDEDNIDFVKAGR